MAHMVLTAIPGTLVHGLFLAPDNIFYIAVGAQNIFQLVVRERIQLLQANQSNIIYTALFALLQQMVINLARAEHHTADLSGL